MGRDASNGDRETERGLMGRTLFEEGPADPTPRIARPTPGPGSLTPNYFGAARVSICVHIIVLSLTRCPPCASIFSMSRDPLPAALPSPPSDEQIDELIAQSDRSAKVTLADVYRALVAARGNKSEAARNLGISRAALSTKVDRHPALLAVVHDLRESVLDKAEDNIFVDVERGDPASSRFVLSTLGKDRGYVQSVSGQGKDGAIEITIRQFAPPVTGEEKGNIG